MITTAEHRRIVSMLAAGQPVWYVAATMKVHRHEVHRIGAHYGYPDRNRLRDALARLAADDQTDSAARVPAGAAA